MWILQLCNFNIGFYRFKYCFYRLEIKRNIKKKKKRFTGQHTVLPVVGIAGDLE